MNCPLCAQALEGGELVMVCGHCHKALGGGLALGATGEFKVPSDAMLAAHGGADKASTGERPHARSVCSWCGKLEHEVRKLLGRSGTALCDVRLAVLRHPRRRARRQLALSYAVACSRARLR